MVKKLTAKVTADVIEIKLGGPKSGRSENLLNCEKYDEREWFETVFVSDQHRKEI